MKETTLDPKPTDSSRAFRGLYILIVDDDADYRLLLQKVLEHRGWRITAVSNVADALMIFKQEAPDVLLSDIGMPGENGYDLIRRVRALPKEQGGGVPAAAMTAFVGDQVRENTLRAGFTMHVPKPITPAELVTVVTSLARMAASNRST